MRRALSESAEPEHWFCHQCVRRCTAPDDPENPRCRVCGESFMEFVGPVGTGTLHPHATDKAVMGRLWDLSEQAVGFEWDLISEPIA